MNPEQSELFRLAILRVMDANRTRFGLGLPAIGFHLNQFGFNAANCGGAENFTGLLADEIDYLAGKQLVEEVLKTVSRENRAWRISPLGIRYVDQRA
jgi:hypothetical protein